MICEAKICREKEAGFSLVELMVVVTLIAIIGAISVPMLMQQRPKWHMRGVAKDLAAKLMMARLKAIQNNKTYAVEIATGAVDSFTLKVLDKVPDPDVWVDSGGTFYGTNDVNIAMNVLAVDCLASNRILFYPSGKALYDTTLPPSAYCATKSVQVVTISEKTGRFTALMITIRPTTGIIKVESVS